MSAPDELPFHEPDMRDGTALIDRVIAENERLHALNAELVEALKAIYDTGLNAQTAEMAIAVLAKAEGRK